MSTKSSAIASSKTSRIFSKIYRLAVLFPQLLIRAITKPKYILLCLWAFKELWVVNSRLKEMALAALKTPAEAQPEIINPQLKKEIRQRAVAIFWTAKIHPLGTKCLHRSLVLYKWLKQQGINPQLEIGWGKDTSIGHAWLTYNGIVLNDRADIEKTTPRLTRVN